MTFLSGILPVLQTPFAEDGSLDLETLRREVDFVVACGAHGIVAPALASEFMLLTDDERRTLVETVVAQAAGRVPVVANVAGTSTQAAVAFAAHAREVGADAVMALSPYLRKPGPDGVVAYYRAISEAARLPVVLQNAPPPFGANLPTALVLRIVAEVDGVRHVKEERLPPGHHVSDLLAGGSDRLAGILGGSAGIYMMSELPRGSTGNMPSAAVTDVLVTIWDAYQRGETERARDLHERLLPLLVMEMSVMMAVSKEVLRRRGVFRTTHMRDPEFPDLDAGDMAELDALWPRVAPLFTV